MTVIKKIRICIFIHYSVSDFLPYNVQIYNNELSRHFDKVKVLTNNSKITDKNISLNKNISFEYLENRGYDFGMFYRYIIQQDFDKYSEIIVVNDSNILLNKLDEIFKAGRKSDADFWGIIDSNEKPWFSSHNNNYHIQSHFIIFNEKAIKMLPSFFNTLNISNIMNEEDNKQLRRLVIDNWEIGLTQYFLKQGLNSFSIIQNEKIRLKFRTKKHNFTHSHYLELASEGYPILKKKVLLKKKKILSFRKKKSIEIELAEFFNNEWDLKKMIREIRQ